MRKYDLEKRLIAFAALIIRVANEMPNSMPGKYLAGQLVRSGTSPALKYAEAQAAESRKDFIHKMKISLKELRETKVCLEIIQESKLFESESLVVQSSKETAEPIAIFVKSIAAASSKLEQL